MSTTKIVGRVIGYGLTALVAFWGLLYVPWQCIKAVEPYSGNNVFDALAALGGGPLVSPMVVVVATLVAYFFPRLTMPPKVMFFTIVWAMSIVGPMGIMGSREIFLSKQVVWTGPCNISKIVWANPPVVELSCDNGKTVKTADTKLVDEFVDELIQFQGKRNFICKLNAAGYTSCKSQPRQ